MISVSEACDIVLAVYNNKVYITDIIEVSKGYVIGIIGLNGEEYDVPPYIIYKETGKWGVFFPPHHKDELKNSKRIEVPEKYKMP